MEKTYCNLILNLQSQVSLSCVNTKLKETITITIQLKLPDKILEMTQFSICRIVLRNMYRVSSVTRS